MNSRKFMKYHRNNPIVWDLFQEYANLIKKAGTPKYSAKRIMNRIRTLDCSISNNYTAYYARMLISTQPEFNGFFTLRGA